MKTNGHGAKLYKDPMNRLVVKVQDHPTTFEATPWVNYQGDLYMRQGGEHLIVTKEPKNIDRWRQLANVRAMLTLVNV